MSESLNREPIDNAQASGDASPETSPANSPAVSSRSSMVRIHVLFFGVLAEQTGRQYLTLDLTEPATLEQALARLQQDYPAVAALRSKLAFAVNLEYVALTCALKDRDELALIPPVSGG